MKKIVLKGLIVSLLIAFTAAPTLAANDGWTIPTATGDAITDDTGTTGPGLSFDDLKFSSNVVFHYASDTTAGAYFGLATYNTKGTKVYATNSASSKIYGSTSEVTPSTYSGISPVASGTTWDTDWAEVGK